MEVSKAEEAKTINHPKERQQTRKDQIEVDKNHGRNVEIHLIWYNITDIQSTEASIEA